MMTIRNWIGGLLIAGSVLASTPTQAARAFRVAYAGSMGVVMDRFIGPTFAAQNGVDYQGIGQGAYGLARQLESRLIQADVFISITPGPIDVLKKADMIGPAVPVASTEMVITYSPHSRFMPFLEAAAQGKRPWYQVLRMPGLRFGRTDPVTDPQGQNIIFTLLLAQSFYKQPNLAHRILGDYRNPEQIFTEPSLLSRLEAGQIDASSGYRSAALSHHLPFIPLPDEINLSNPDMDARWYKTVGFSIRLPDGKILKMSTQPLVFYATVLKASGQPALARKFIAFLRGPDGRKMLREHGYGPPKGGPIP